MTVAKAFERWYQLVPANCRGFPYERWCLNHLSETKAGRTSGWSGVDLDPGVFSGLSRSERYLSTTN